MICADWYSCVTARAEGNVTRIFTTSPMTLALTELGRKQAREAANII